MKISRSTQLQAIAVVFFLLSFLRSRSFLSRFYTFRSLSLSLSLRSPTTPALALSLPPAFVHQQLVRCVRLSSRNRGALDLRRGATTASLSFSPSTALSVRGRRRKRESGSRARKTTSRERALAHSMLLRESLTHRASIIEVVVGRTSIEKNDNEEERSIFPFHCFLSSSLNYRVHD